MSGKRRGGKDGDDRERGDRSESEKGPGKSQFLDLELSQVLYSEAEQMAKQVALDLIREGIRDRLRERLGPQLSEIGHLAADELVDDMEANLAIEARITARHARAADLAARVQSALQSERPTKKKR